MGARVSLVWASAHPCTGQGEGRGSVQLPAGKGRGLSKVVIILVFLLSTAALGGLLPPFLFPMSATPTLGTCYLDF